MKIPKLISFSSFGSESQLKNQKPSSNLTKPKFISKNDKIRLEMSKFRSKKLAKYNIKKISSNIKINISKNNIEQNILYLILKWLSEPNEENDRYSIIS